MTIAQFAHTVSAQLTAFLFVVLATAPVQANLLGTEWTMTSDEVIGIDPEITSVEEVSSTKDGRILKLQRDVALDTEYVFTAYYYFRETDDLLDLIVLELRDGSPSGLYDLYNQAVGPGEVETDRQLIRNKLVHKVRFIDESNNNKITYDLRGDECKLIFKPYVRGVVIPP
jgi:hypothetical protein